MSHLIRLVYASRSVNSPESGAVDPAIGSILSQSRRNNQKAAVGGVLFFGDGYFFQCLEGEESAVTATYARILKDKRHHDARVLSKQPADSRLFSDWSMKFVPAADDVQRLLQQHGYQRFTPFSFSGAFVNELLTYFRQAQLAQYDPADSDPAAKARPARRSFWQRLAAGLKFS